MKELRIAYLEYARAYKTLIFSQPFIGDEGKKFEFAEIGEKEQGYYSARDALYILAPENVVDKVRSHDQAVRDWLVAYNSLPEARTIELRRLTDMLVQAFQATMQAFREDTQHQGKSEITWSVRSPSRLKPDKS